MTNRTQIELTGDAERQAEQLLHEARNRATSGAVVLCQLSRQWQDGDARTILDCAILDRDQAHRLQRAINTGRQQ